MTSNQDSCANQNACCAFGWPVLFLCLSVFVWSGFQVYMVYNQRIELQKSYAAQEDPLQKADKVRKLLSGVTQGLLNLAKAGNQNAVEMIANLKKSGVTISGDDEQQSQPGTAQAASPAPPGGAMMMRQFSPSSSPAMSVPPSGHPTVPMPSAPPPQQPGK